jgi:hypothetical protein
MNPFIYSLRNKDMVNAFKKLISRITTSLWCITWCAEVLILRNPKCNTNEFLVMKPYIRWWNMRTMIWTTWM